MNRYERYLEEKRQEAMKSLKPMKEQIPERDFEMRWYKDNYNTVFQPCFVYALAV